MHGIARDVLHRLREPAARQALDVRMRRVVAQQLHVARGQRHSVRFEQRYGSIARQPASAGAQQLVQLVQRAVELPEDRRGAVGVALRAQLRHGFGHGRLMVARVRHQLQKRIGAQQPIAEPQPRAQRREIVRIEVQPQERGQLEVGVTALGARVALDLPAVEPALHGDAAPFQLSRDALAPSGVRHGHSHVAWPEAIDQALPHGRRRERELGRRVVQRAGLARRGRPLARQRHQAVGLVGKRAEPVEARVRLLGAGRGQRAAGRHEAVRRQMAHEALRRLAERPKVVCHQRQRLALDLGFHKAAIRQRRNLARQQRAARLQVLGEDGVHGLLFGGDQPALVIVGAVADALVEELEHLAQPARLEAAHLHVLHEHGQLVLVQHARVASHGVADLRIAQNREGQLARRHHIERAQQRIVGRKRPKARGCNGVGAHDAHVRPRLDTSASRAQQRRRNVVGRIVLHAQALRAAIQFLKKIVRRVFDGRSSTSTHIRSPSILRMKPFARSPPAS